MAMLTTSLQVKRLVVNIYFVFGFGTSYSTMTLMESNLTEKQQRLLKYIKSYTSSRSYPPSLREMADHMGIRSLSGVHQQLSVLQRKGYIERDSSRRRNVQIEDIPRLVKVPLLGQIAAGLPIEPIEDSDPEYVSTNLIKDPHGHYALRVRGDSMIEDGIQDGDIVLVKSQGYIEYPGQTVVAITDGGATLKKFGGITEDHMIKLIPRNPRMNVMLVDAYDFEVRGIFAGLIRSA